MRKLKSVIFALTHEEIEYGLDCIASKANQHIFVLTPDLLSQLKLLQAGHSPDYYFVPEYYSSSYYGSSYISAENIVFSLTQAVLKDFIKELPALKQYILPFQSWFEMSFLEILETYKFFSYVSKKYKPDFFYINGRYKNNKTDLYSPFASQWEIMRKHFIPRQKVKIFYTSRHANSKLYFFKILAEVFKKINLDVFPVLFGRIRDRFFKNLDSLNKSSDVLIFSGGRNLYIYAELIKSLLRQGYKTRIVTSAQSLWDEIGVKRKKIPYIRLEKFMTKEIANQSSLIENDVRAQVVKTLKRVIKKNSRNLHANIQKALVTKAEFIVLQSLNKIIFQSNLAELILNKYSPKVVITTHDPGPTAMPFVLSAKRINIPTILLMHGWQDTIMGVNFSSDFIAVWSTYIASWYRKRLHKPKKRVKVLGFPSVDFQNKTEAQRSLPVSGSLKIGILLTMYLPNTALQSKFIRELFQEVSMQKNEMTISVRSHPGQPTDGIGEFAEMYGLKVRINVVQSLEEFVNENDVFLSWDTTAMFWVMSQGKPLFYCAPNWSNGITPIDKLGGAWIVSGARDFLQQIESRLAHPKELELLRKKQRFFLKTIVGGDWFTSTQKHLNFIKQVVSRS